MLARVKHFVAVHGADNDEKHLHHPDRNDEPDQERGLEIVVRGQEVPVAHVVEAGVDQVGEGDVLADGKVEGARSKEWPQRKVDEVGQPRKPVEETLDGFGEQAAVFSHFVPEWQRLVVERITDVLLLDRLDGLLEDLT